MINKNQNKLFLCSKSIPEFNKFDKKNINSVKNITIF